MKSEQWYSASSICTPSRFGLLTGQNPSRFKDQLLSALMFMADEHKETGIQQGETTIAETLRESVFDGGLDYFELGRQIKVAGSEEAMVPDVGVLFFNSGASRVRRLIADKFR